MLADIKEKSMKIKAKLNKPYTDSERLNFIIIQNHQKGYEIRETDTELQAWGYTTEEKQAQEQERVNNLTMTPLDFIKVLQSFGLSLVKINEFLESNLDIKMQLTYCSNVYCGVVKSFLPMTIDEITITPEMAEQAFKLKNGEVITND